jgi:hypothetical protein
MFGKIRHHIVAISQVPHERPDKERIIAIVCNETKATIYCEWRSVNIPRGITLVEAHINVSSGSAVESFALNFGGPGESKLTIPTKRNPIVVLI